jgi:hypothetical protein
MAAAEQTARGRLLARGPGRAADLLALAPSAHAAVAQRLAAGLAAALGVPADRLRAADRLEALLRVTRDELPEISAEDWRDSGLAGAIQVHPYDVMWLVESTASRQGWAAQRATLPAPPRTEEEWIDCILGMRVDEFLRFFALAAPAPRAAAI